MVLFLLGMLHTGLILNDDNLQNLGGGERGGNLPLVMAWHMYRMPSLSSFILEKHTCALQQTKCLATHRI